MVEESINSFEEMSFKMNQFMGQFEVDTPQNYKGVNGFFGYMSFEAVQYFDTLTFDEDKRKVDIPELNYKLFRYIIAINHFNDELYILENIPTDQDSSLEKIEALLSNQNFGQYQFKMEGEEKSNICLLYTSPSPRDATLSRMPSSA